MIAAIMAAPAGTLIVVIVLVAVFGAAKGQVEDAHDEVAAEAVREGKNPPSYVTGSSTGDTGCLLAVVVICALGLTALIAGALPPGVLLPK